MRINEYPVPSYAARVWVAGDRLWLALPPDEGFEHGHSIPYPIDIAALRGLSADEPALRGVVLALETLRHRGASAFFGPEASHTRHEIERAAQNDSRYKAWLKAQEVGKAEARTEREEAEQFLKELGL